MSEIINIPNEITLDEYTYKYKCKLKDGYSYRCRNRKHCSIIIKIELDEIKRYLKKEHNIKYIITSTKKNHECSLGNNSENQENNKPKKFNDDSNINKNDKKGDNLELAKTLMFSNLDKPLSFHKTNLENNNIYLTINQIKWNLQKLREKTYMADEKYLLDISKITIDFENENPELKNLILCHKYCNVINPNKKNILEKYLIFTTSMQINMISKCTQILIDGTFKSCPRSFYQILNISGYLPEINSIIPIFMIPMTGKSEYLYDIIFKDVKQILSDNNFDIKDFPERIMIDFEIALQNSVKNNFPQSIINGCFFHFSKLMWSKAKTLGLCKKKELQKTKLFIFIIKLITFMNPDDKEKFFEKFEKYFSIDNDKYQKFIKYFKKIWLNNKYINYYDLSKEEYLNRTNNYIESFHHILNEQLDCFHPKISYLISKYKLYLKKIYEKIKNSLVIKHNIKEEKFSIINDIYQFIKNFNSKYNTKLDFNIILQSDEEDLKIIDKVGNYLLEIFLDYYNDDSQSLKNKNLGNNEINDDNIDENNNNDDDKKNYYKNTEIKEYEDDLKLEDDSNEDDNNPLNLEIFYEKNKNNKKKEHIMTHLGKIMS